MAGKDQVIAKIIDDARVIRHDIEGQSAGDAGVVLNNYDAKRALKALQLLETIYTMALEADGCRYCDLDMEIVRAVTNEESLVR